MTKLPKTQEELDANLAAKESESSESEPESKPESAKKPELPERRPEVDAMLGGAPMPGNINGPRGMSAVDDRPDIEFVVSLTHFLSPDLMRITINGKDTDDAIAKAQEKLKFKAEKTKQK